MLVQILFEVIHRLSVHPGSTGSRVRLHIPICPEQEVPVVQEIVNIIEPELRVLRPLCQLRLHFVYIHRHSPLGDFDDVANESIVLLPAFVKVRFLIGSDYYAGSAPPSRSMADLGTSPNGGSRI